MGRVADLAAQIHTKDEVNRPRPTDPLYPPREPPQDLWRRAFGTTKETTHRDTQDRQLPEPGGSYGRSITSSQASFKRLLQAMRSMAPGGWSDNRWAETSLFIGMTYVAITAKCRMMSQAEFQVFRKDPRHPDGKIPVAENEPGYDLVRLLERPNNQDSWGEYLWRITQQIDLTGTALTWMVPNQLGKPMELYCIPTCIAIPQPAINPDFPDGYYRIQPVYPYGPFSSYPTPASAVGAPIPSQWMLRFQYPHPLLRYDGYSPRSGMSLNMDALDMLERSRFYSLRKSFNPSAVLDLSEMEDAQQLTDAAIDRMRAEFENAQQGPENHGTLFVPPPGGKIDPWGASPVDMDYQNGWDQLTSFILGGYGMTKPAAGMVEDSSYQTLFATLKQIHLITLQPDADRFASKLTRHLAPFFGDNLIVEIRCKRIDDHDVKANKLGQLIQAKALTINELRKELDMPLTKEEWGSQRCGEEPQQQGMPGMEGMEGGEEEAIPEEQEEEALIGELQDAALEGVDEEEPTPPSAGNLSEGSLGPKDHQGKPSLPKSLSDRMKGIVGETRFKSMYDRVKEACANGSHS